MLADCLHALDALGPGGLPTLLGALFLAGLAGGVTHCTTMCAPFVLAQAATGLGAGGGMLGGREVKLEIVDDELKPDVAVARARRLVEQDKADFVVGPIFSNVLAAIFRPVTGAHCTSRSIEVSARSRIVAP